MANGRKGVDPRSPLTRLMEKVRADDNGCWIFTGTLGHGYGSIYMPPRGHTVRAHRLAYELAKGPIPDGLELDPQHLEAVTHDENQRRRQLVPDCKRGDPFDEVNTRWVNGRRQCLECQRAAKRAYKKRERTKRVIHSADLPAILEALS